MSASQERRGRPTSSGSSSVRLNKAIADAGVSSRRQADQLVEEGRVRVNGRVVTTLGTKVGPSDEISVDNRILRGPERLVYYLLNKPRDVITTVDDPRNRRTVVDLVDVPQRVYPVGRLDRNTTGVLLLTNDGDLAHRMMHPSYQIERHYEAILDKPLEMEHARQIAEEGVDIGSGERSSPCFVSVLEQDRRSVELILAEGKNREIRRIFEALGYRVDKLNRRGYGGLSTRGLRRGEYRPLKSGEVKELRKRLKLS